MAKTVGLPLGIAAKLILNGRIKLSGLHIPNVREIYEPVLEELELYQVKFTEQHYLIDLIGMPFPEHQLMLQSHPLYHFFINFFFPH